MKLKLLLAIVEKMLGASDKSKEPRADMYLPVRSLAIAIVLIGAGIGCGIFAYIKFEIALVVFAVLCIPAGIACLLCWKNQSIEVLSNEIFVYTTMFGNKHTYYFADIKGIRHGKDSSTLLVGDGKVFIDSSAVMSDRLKELINSALQ